MRDLPNAPHQWAWARLGEIAEVKLGKMLSSKAREKGLRQLPYLRNQNVGWGSIDLTDVKTMGFKPGEVDRYSVQPGDLLVCEGGEPARCAVYEGPPGSLMYQKALHRVRPQTQVTSSRFLHYCLWYYASNGVVLPRPSETTIQHLPLEKMVALHIPLPPLAEQRRIVEALDAQFTRLDAAVGILERVRASLDRFRSAVMQAAFEGRLGSAVGIAEWDTALLGEIADVKGGLAKGKKRSARERTRSVPYLRVANVQRGYLDLAEVKEIEATESEIASLQLHDGDVLFNEGGDRDKLGRGWVWRGHIPTCIHQNHVFRARLTRPNTDPRFVSWYGNSTAQGYFMREGKQTTNLASISLRVLRSLPVPLPLPAEQRRIVEEIDDHLSMTSAIDGAVARSERRIARLRQSILRLAFDGRLVPQDPRDEPASVLLDRIRASRAAIRSPHKRTSTRSPR